MSGARSPFVRLVHNLERRRARPSYSVTLTLHDDTLEDSPRSVLASASVTTFGPRAFVVGSADRVSLRGPRHLLARHLAVVCIPLPQALEIRIVALHPERYVLPHPAVTRAESPQPPALKALPEHVGGVTGIGRVEVVFEGIRLCVEAAFDVPDATGSETVRSPWRNLPMGTQLAFHLDNCVRALGKPVSSVAGPSAGGHAVPALLKAATDDEMDHGALVLRAQSGVHRVDASPDALQRGLLVGRSRFCVLGRGFDEHDGLSRLHALVIAIREHVYAIDLSSRYGLRDIARPHRLLSAARIDNGVGCLVYGGGHLLMER